MPATETQKLEPTPTVIEGPYYKLCSPHRSVLVEPDDPGVRIVVSGHVYTPEGHPIPNATVDVWSSDGIVGDYDMVGDKYRGHVFTDARGAYEFETIIAACYEPRDAKHLHVKVQGVSRPLTTQLYFSNDERRVKDHYFMKELEIQVADGPDGKKRGTFDFVIGQVTEKENVTKESLSARV